MFSKSTRSFLLGFAGCVLLLGSQAFADVGSVIPMGDLERWGAFTLGTGVPNRLSNNNEMTGYMQGDFGAAGNGDITLSGNATVVGDIYYRSNGQLKIGSSATHTGAQFDNQDALLDQDVDAALTASDAAAGLAATRPDTKITLSGNATANFGGAPGETVVLNLKCFKMSGNTTLTLNGAVDTTYVINVKKGFSLAGHSSIVLTGGLDWNDVVFNVRGKGKEVLLNRDSSFQGILLAHKRNVRERDNAILRGEVIANNLQLEGSSQLIHPPVVSP